MQVPIEMAGSIILAAMAAAVQDKYIARPRPDWKETLSAYLSVVAPPAFRKSAVLSALMAPHFLYERDRQQQERAEVDRSKARIRALDKAAQAVDTRFASGKATMDDVLNASAELEDARAKEMYEYRLLANDTTPEKLAELMAQQGGSLTVVSSEGGIFDAMAGKRYDNGVNVDLYLQAHCGDPVTIERIGRQGSKIANPRLSMILTVQPQVLQGLISNQVFRGRGLCGRFMYVMCHNNLGHRKVDPEPVPDKVKEDYTRLIYRLLSSPYRGEITFDPVATQIRQSYQEYIERKLGNEWEFMGDWGGKAVGMVVRLAAILHIAQCMGDPTQEPVNAETMAAATRLGEFLSSHAEAAYQVMGADQDVADAKYLLKRIKGIGDLEISKRDLFNQCKGKFKRVDQMEPALQTLIDMGYIRVADVSTGGRPTQKIMVNPMEQK